jgi:hypothetical protein
MPEEVNKEEWGNKYLTHGYSPFTEKEKEFFVQFSKSDSYYLNLDNIHSELRPSLNSNPCLCLSAIFLLLICKYTKKLLQKYNFSLF